MPRHPILASTRIFRGRILELVVDRIRLPNGDTGEREFIRHPGAVGLVAITESRVLMVRQNRHSIGEDLLEIPAGKLSPRENPEDCARRELLEETGYRAGKLEPLARYYSSPGFTDEVIHLFLTTDLAPGAPPPQADEGEPISIEWLGLDDAIGAIRTGDLADAKSIIGILLAVRVLGS